MQGLAATYRPNGVVTDFVILSFVFVDVSPFRRCAETVSMERTVCGVHLSAAAVRAPLPVICSL